MRNLIALNVKRIYSGAFVYVMLSIVILLSVILLSLGLADISSNVAARPFLSLPEDMDVEIAKLDEQIDDLEGSLEYEARMRLKLLEYYRDNGITVACHNTYGDNIFELSYVTGAEYTAYGVRVVYLLTTLAAVIVILLGGISESDSLRIITSQRRIPRFKGAISRAIAVTVPFWLLGALLSVIVAVVGVTVLGGLSSDTLVYVFGEPMMANTGILSFVLCVYYALTSLFVMMVAGMTLGLWHRATACVATVLALVFVGDLNGGAILRPILSLSSFMGTDAPVLYFLGEIGTLAIVLALTAIGVVIYTRKERWYVDHSRTR